MGVCQAVSRRCGVSARRERLNIDAVVVSTLFEEARQAETQDELLHGLSVGLARLEATGAFSKLDRSVEEVRLDKPTVVGGSHGLKLRIGAKPFKYNMQVGARVNARGETEAFTEVRLPNLTGHLDSLALRIGEDQGDLLADTASLASGGGAAPPPSGSPASRGTGVGIGSGRGLSLLRARQASPWVQASYTKPTLAGTRWALEVSAKQSATSWDARQSLRLRERQAGITLTDPSGRHSFGLALTERRPRLARLPGPGGAGLARPPPSPPAAAKVSSSALDAVQPASALLGAPAAPSEALPGAAGALFATSASHEVAAGSAPSLKGALVYGFTVDSRPRVAAGAPCSGGSVSANVELAGVPALSSVSHAKASLTASHAFSLGRFAPDTGFALPPTSSQRASPASLSRLRSSAAQQGLLPHPGPSALPFLPTLPAGPSDRAARPRPTIRSLAPGVQDAPQTAPSRLSLDPRAPTSGWREVIAGWLAPGLTVVASSTVGVLVPLPPAWGIDAAWRSVTGSGGPSRQWAAVRPGSAWGAEPFRPAVEPASAADLAAEPSELIGRSSVLDRFQLGAPALRGFAGEGIGPKGGVVRGGGEHGDSLGGDFSASLGVRLLGPPPLPSVTLVNAGVRTQAWANAGVILPGPLRSLSPVVFALTDSTLWSAAAGVGVTVPMGGLANLELNYTLAHSGPGTDLRQVLSMAFSA